MKSFGKKNLLLHAIFKFSTTKRLFKSIFTTYVKAVSSKATIVYCFIDRFAPCTKVLPEKMLLCLKRVIKLVNFIKISAVNTRLFKRLCEDFGFKHTCLLYYTEVRWLSRGNATKRLFKLRDELLQFSNKKNHNFKQISRIKSLLQGPTYLTFWKF